MFLFKWMKEHRLPVNTVISFIKLVALLFPESFIVNMFVLNKQKESNMKYLKSLMLNYSCDQFMRVKQSEIRML